MLELKSHRVADLMLWQIVKQSHLFSLTWLILIWSCSR
jgi:hypothetical protein